MVQPSCLWLQGALLFAWKIMLRMDALPTFCTACEALEFVLHAAWIESPGRHTTHKSEMLSTTHCFLRSGSTKSIVQPKSSQTGCPALDYHVLVQSGGGGGAMSHNVATCCAVHMQNRAVHATAPRRTGTTEGGVQQLVGVCCGVGLLLLWRSAAVASLNCSLVFHLDANLMLWQDTKA